MYLNQVSNVHGHLVNLCVVKLLDVLKVQRIKCQEVTLENVNAIST